MVLPYLSSLAYSDSSITAVGEIGVVNDKQTAVIALFGVAMTKGVSLREKTTIN